jgi:hypothetical protein
MASWSGTRRGRGLFAIAAARITTPLLLAALAAALLWSVSIYAGALRDPRYFDGWLLAAGMGLQLGFHIAIKTNALSPKTAARWKAVHIFLGYVLIAAFVSHSDFSLPDTAFEWALSLCFMLVTLSGVFGSYLAWVLRSKRGNDERITLERIASRQAELQREVEAVVAMKDPAAAAMPLPAQPHDAWIDDLYAKHLYDFFSGPRHAGLHLIGSQRHLKQLTEEIEHLARYGDRHTQTKLAALHVLVIEKDRLDFANVHLKLTKAWLFIHVPVTYALFVLALLHVVVVYAFSSGDW